MKEIEAIVDPFKLAEIKRNLGIENIFEVPLKELKRKSFL